MEQSIEQILESIKDLGKLMKTDFIIAFKQYRVEYHHSHRAMVIERREAETIELPEEED